MYLKIVFYQYALKGVVHDWGECLFTKMILHEILKDFLQKVIKKLKLTNHFEKDKTTRGPWGHYRSPEYNKNFRLII